MEIQVYYQRSWIWRPKQKQRFVLFKRHELDKKQNFNKLFEPNWVTKVGRNIISRYC